MLCSVCQKNEAKVHLTQIVDDKMHFQVISRTGKTVDSGTIVNPRKKNGLAAQ